MFYENEFEKENNAENENIKPDNENIKEEIPKEAPEGEIKEKEETAEKASIVYDAEKNGSYSWNYAEEKAKKEKKEKKEKKKANGYTAFIAVAMCFVIVGTALASSLITADYIEKNRQVDFYDETTILIPENKDEKDKVESVVSVDGIPMGNVLTKQQIAVKCKPASVGIEVSTTVRSIYGYTYQTAGVGSGFILTKDGYVATNNHVIEGAEKITVQLDNGKKYDATLVGTDAITDLAVLKIEAKNLVPMEIGDSDKMVVGDSVVAIGTPAGIEFAGTVTDGIISAINRNVEITNERGTVVKTMTLMQTNAAINPGNSGGPLINNQGEVIGINTLKLTSAYEGIGFSIPINSAVKIFNQLIRDGKVSEYDSNFVTGNGAIGITQYAEVSQREAEYYGIPEGIIVIQINNSSSAVSAGLRRGDIITAFNGEKVKTVDELNNLKNKFKAGDDVTLTVHRDGEGDLDITFKLDLMQS